MNDRVWQGAAGDPAPETRRVVTVLFADLVGSTGLGERLDPEQLRALQARYFAVLRTVVERHGGTVEKFIGDAVMAVFGYPQLHEDDALRAARAALELSPALSQLNIEVQRRYGQRLRLRVGMHSGEVVSGDGADALVTGDAVNLASRLQAAAMPDDILVSSDIAAILRGAVITERAGTVAIRGRDRPVETLRLLGLTGADVRARLDGPFVGREKELAVMGDAMATAMAGATRLVTVLAPAGVGKSRLVRESLARARDHPDVLHGRCLPYGDGITWWPILEVLRAAAGLTDTDRPEAVGAALDRLVTGMVEGRAVRPVLATLLGQGDAEATADDVSWAIRRLLARLTTRRPVCMVIEDIHWAAPPMLDLIETIIDWSPDLRLLIVCPARPDLLDARPGWGSGHPNATNLTLETLDDDDAGALLRSLPGGDAIPPPLADRIRAAADGNPLFLEEMVAQLVDEGRLVQAGGDWELRGDGSSVHVPASITALVSARVDGLPPAERRAAERGAVVGRAFERGAVAALSSDRDRGRLGPALMGLTRRGMIRPDGTGIDGDDAFQFRHVLLRDAAYARIPKGERAEFHVAFADWLTSVAGDRAAEYMEIVAHHLAAAAEYRLAFDPLAGWETRTLATRAIAALEGAIERARRVHAWPEVALLCDRTLTLLHDADLVDTEGMPETVDLTIVAAIAEEMAGLLEGARARLEIGLADPAAHGPLKRARLLQRLAMVRRDLGDEPGALRALEEALAGLPSTNRTERGMVLATRGRLRLLMTQDHIGAIADSEAAVLLADGPDDIVWRAGALVTRASALGDVASADQAEAAFAVAVAEAERSGDAEAILRAYNNLGAFLGAQGKHREACTAMRVGLARTETMGVDRSRQVLNIRLNLAGSAAYEARFADGHAEVDALEALEPRGDPAVWLWQVRGWLFSLEGRWHQARIAFGRAREVALLGATAAMHAYLALREAQCEILAGDLGSASRYIRTAMRYTVDTGFRAELSWTRACHAADVAASARAAGDADVAEAAIARALAAAADLDDADSGRSSGVVTRFPEMHLVSLEAARARAEPSSTGWDRAADTLEGLGWVWYATYARYRLAEASLREAVDPHGAAARLDEAEAAARDVGAYGLLERVRALRTGPPRVA